MRAFWIYRFPAVMWMMLIFFLSSISGDDLPDIDIPYIHMIAHFVEYVVLGFLLSRSFTHSVGKEKKVFVSVTAFVIAVLFALSDEWHQTFVAGRNGEWMTVGYDAIFSVLGIIVFWITLRVFNRN
ncbi:MAG TPA: VanZ family protein [Candidatus Omnitrophota bacterium]|nr:VanZ family protein [Candidatus Omnitrophota bacterium]